METDPQQLLKYGLELAAIVVLWQENRRLSKRIEGMSANHGPHLIALQKEHAELKGKVTIIEGLLFRRVAERMGRQLPLKSRTGEVEKPTEEP